MSKCFSLTASRDWCYRYSFANAGLRSLTTDLGDGTVMHYWVPKTSKQNKPNLLLIHGIGANAMWQWNELISPLISRFNVYVPDLVFFGDSSTTRPDQARCVMSTMEVYEDRKLNVVGISYGGFVGYSLAAQFPEVVERLLLCCAGVTLEDKDMEEGMFTVKSVEEAVSILFLLPLIFYHHILDMCVHLQTINVVRECSKCISPPCGATCLGFHLKLRC